MKKVLLALLAIALLAVIGVGVFIATFDLDRYRPMVTQELQKALGRPVTLGRLKLGWQNGLAVQAQQIAVRESEAAQSPALIEVEQVSALVQLQPLLRKEIQITTVVIERPVIRASRNAQGEINLVGPAVAAAPAAASNATAAGGSAAPMKFEVDAVRIEHGTVLWKDAAATPPREVALNQLDVDVKHIAPGRPMDISVRGALESDRQNFSMTGRVTLPSGSTPLSATELKIQLSDVPLEPFLPKDAPRVPLKSFTLSVPQLTPGQPADVKIEAAVGSDQPNMTFSGRITPPAGQAPLSATGLHIVISDPPLAAFMPKGSPPPVPLKSVDITVPQFTLGQPMDVKVAAAVASDQPNVDFSGRVTLPAPPAPGAVQQMKLNVRQLDLAAIAPPPKSAKDPRVRGTVSLALDGALPTLDPAQLMRQFSAKGRLQVAEPVVENLNVIREVLNKLALIPGLGERMRSKLPPEYQAKLDAKDTVLKSIDTPLNIEYGVLRTPDLVIQSDTFGISGFGPINLVGPVSTPAQIRLDPDFSAALISSVNELQALTNQKAELELPLTLTSTAPNVALDIQYVLSRIAGNKINDFLGDLLNKNAPQQPAAPGQPAPGGAAAPQAQPVQPAQSGQPAQPQSGEELLGQFLQRVLQPPPSQQDPAQQQQ